MSSSLVLTYDKTKTPCSNVVAYKEDLYRRFVEKYGLENAGFISSGMYPAFPPTPVPDIDDSMSPLLQKAAEKAYFKAASKRTDDMDSFKADKPKIYMAIVLELKRNQSALERCEGDLEWLGLTTSLDPLGLIQLMSRALLTSSAHSNPSAAKLDWEKAMANLRQGSMTLLQYRDRYKELLAQGDALGKPRGLERDHVERISGGLGPQYNDCVTSLANGLKPYPDTWEGMITVAENWKVATSTKAPTPTPAASGITMGTGTELEKGTEFDALVLALSKVMAKLSTKGGKPSAAQKPGKKGTDTERTRFTWRTPNPATKDTVYDVTKDEEYAKARVNGHCLGCGRANHRIADCPDAETGGIALTCVVIDEEVTCSLADALIHPMKQGGDSLSSVHLQSNRQHVTNIRITPRRIRVKGLNGNIVLDKVADMRGVGEVYFWEGGNVNLLSIGKMVRDGARRTTDPDWNTDTFEFQDGTVLVFRRVQELTEEDRQLDVYVCDMREEQALTSELALVGSSGTVEENERLYTKKEVERAYAATALWKNMNNPGMEVFSKMLTRGTVHGVNLTPEDVRRGIRIAGRPLQNIRGRTRNRKVRKINPVPIYRTIDKLLVMRIDIMFVSGLMFLVSTTAPLLLGMANYITRKSAAIVYAALKPMLSAYTAAGFVVSDVVCDGEGAISKLKPELEERGVRVHVAGKGTHVPEAEERVRTYKEGIRGVLSTLPFKLPFCLLMWLVYYVVSRRNMIPHSASSEFIPPVETYRCRKLDYRADVPLAFGARCEVFDKSDNTMASRTRPGMFLNSLGTESGTMRFVMLDTWHLASSDRYEELPVDADFIAALNAKAAKGKETPLAVEVLLNDMPVYSDGESEATGESEAPVRRGEQGLADYDPGEQQLLASSQGGSSNAIVETGIEVREDPPTATLDERVMVDPDIFARAAATGEPLPQQPDGGVPQDPAIIAGNRGARPSLSAEESRGVPFPGEDRGVQPSDGEHERGAGQLVHEEVEPAKPTRDHGLRPKRSNALRDGRWQERDKDGIALKVSLEVANDMYGAEADRAATAEMTGIHQKGVFKARHWSSMTTAEKKSVIISQLFLKEKYMSTGEFEKLKARLVAGGHMQDRDAYSWIEISAPTVSLTSVNLVAGIAAKENRHAMSMDVPQAFLNGRMKHAVFMRIEPALAALMCKIPGSDYSEHLRKDGSLIVELVHALYGTLEAAKIWFDVIQEFLLSLGFTQNRKDKCIFNKMMDGEQLTVAVYVDDTLSTCKSAAALKWLADMFERRFPGMSVNTGAVHSFLGETWDFSQPGKVAVTMTGNIGKMLEDYGVEGTAVTPATSDLFAVDDASPPLEESARQRFHTFVQKLQWVAKRVAPQLGPAISFLLPRVLKATEQDRAKLDRVMRYMNANRGRGIVIEPGAEGLHLHAYVDASFAVHESMRSHTGVTIGIGEGPVFTKSSVQKPTSMSSTEAELIGVSDALPQVIWVRDFLVEQGYTIGPAVLYQDNQSTIKLAERGSAASERTRHVAIRFFFVYDRIQSGEIVVEYMPTGHMVADILTKPLQGTLFRRLLAKLTNWYEPGEREEFA